jgi:hypothetical protein
MVANPGGKKLAREASWIHAGKFAKQIELAFSSDVDWIGDRSNYGCVRVSTRAPLRTAPAAHADLRVHPSFLAILIKELAAKRPGYCIAGHSNIMLTHHASLFLERN